MNTPRCLILYMPQSLLYATPYFAHFLHHTRDTMGFWIQSRLLLLHFASLRPAWRKTPEALRNKVMLSGGLAERSSAEEQTKRISDQFTGTRCENKLLQGLDDTKTKMKEPTTPIYTFWICSKPVWGHFLCVCDVNVLLQSCWKSVQIKR